MPLKSSPASAARSQSNLIGIETRYPYPEAARISPLNRTLLELKPGELRKLVHQCRGSQSNLIGIETRHGGCEVSAPRHPLNRTLLELKQNRRKLAISTLNSQSNLIGIET